MKRIFKSLLAVGLAISMVLPGTLGFAAVEEETELRYSYKIDGAKNDFMNSYGYTGGSDAGRGDGGGKRPATVQVTGKYGSAIRVDLYGYKVLDPALSYGAVVFQFFHNPITVGYERIHFDDYIQEVQSLSFWTRTPKMQYNDPGVNVRKMTFMIGTSNGNYQKSVDLPDTDEWVYVVLPFDEMMNGGKSLRDALDAGELETINTFQFDFGQSGKNFFGAEPTDETREDPSKQWYEYIIIDELLLDRSTPENPAIIPASDGEESYLMNANLKTMAVDGIPVAGFDPNASVNEIVVPGNYTAEDILEHVTAIVEAPSIPADSSHQPVSGATYEIDPPASIPGEGKVTVYSADYSDKRTYQLSFVARNGFQVNTDEITGIDFSQSAVPGGNTTVSVPIVNESSEETASGTVIGLVRDTQTGEVYSIDTADTGEMAPGTSQAVSLDFNVPGNGDYCMASLYFVDSLANLNTIYPAISTGSDQAVLTEDSTASLTSKAAVIDNGTRQITVSGTVSNAQTDEMANIAVYRPNAEKTAENLVNFAAAKIENGRFTYTYTNNIDENGYAKIDIGVGGQTEETGVYVADEAQVNAAMEAYQALTADAGDDAYLAFMESYGGALGCPMEMYDALTQSVQAGIVEDTVGKGYTYSALTEALSQAIALAYLNSNATAADLADAFQQYQSAFGFDTANAYYQDYVTTSERLEEVFAGMQTESYDTLDEAAEGFDAYVVLCAINHVSSYQDITSILSDNRSVVGNRFNYTKYNSLTTSQKSGFASKVRASDTLTDFDDLNDLLTQYIDSVKDGSNNSSGPSYGPSNRPSTGNTTTEIITSGDITPPTPTETPVVNTSRFSDMVGVEWAIEAVDTLYDLGIVSGDGTGKFNPNGNVTREEFAKMLVGVFGFENTGNPVSFYDVDENEWYAEYVQKAAQNGIVLGDETGNFGVGQFITRQDMAVMILRALDTIDKKPNTTVENTFADDMEIADYAKEAVYGMNNAGIVSGVGENRFAPLQNATRAEAAKMLYGVYQYAALGN